MKDELSVLEHVGELRKRVIGVLIVFAAMLAVGLGAARYVFDYLQSVPPAADLNLHAFSPWSGIRVYMQFALIIGVTGTLPFLLYQAWAFVKPGLQKQERAAAVRYIPFSFLLGAIGLVFAYFVVFKMALYFTTTVNRNMSLDETYGITEYFSFLFNILLPVSVLFELPVVVLFLTRIGLLTPARLRRVRKIAYVALVFTATVVTPPDLISDLLVAVPLILLYEVSALLSRHVYRKMRTAGGEEPEEKKRKFNEARSGPA